MKWFSTAGTMKIPTPHQVINSSKTSHRFQPAFTLVELLVVIAILAILAALLFPLVGSMRRSTSSAISVSNLRQIGTAIVTYAADNNGTLPGPTFMHQYPRYQTFGSTGPLAWILRDYLLSVPQPDNPKTNMFYSPAFDYPAARTDAKNPYSVDKPTYKVYINVADSIGIFQPLGYAVANSAGQKPPAMTTVQLATRDTRGKPWITESDHPTAIQNPHGQYRNTLMFDYSVKAIPLSEF